MMTTLHSFLSYIIQYDGYKGVLSTVIGYGYSLFVQCIIYAQHIGFCSILHQSTAQKILVQQIY